MKFSQILIIGMLATVVAGGCAAQPDSQEQNDSQSTASSNQPLIDPNDPARRFENEYFSLSLPAPVDKSTDRAIVPKNEGDFERINFMVEQKENEKSPFDIESERNYTICSQSELCGVMANNVDVTIDGAEGIKYETNMLGRSQDDLEGETYGFYYALERDGRYFRLWTITTDQRDPEKVEQMFDEALATLTFKEA
ncbi:hypothetical protein KC725_00230 [Candidatus Peregrinibacteria bacterium]|nr:hypothetical protein [Candidatus Peregrinibacteria bacterium]